MKHRLNPFDLIYRNPSFANPLKDLRKMMNFPRILDVELTNYCNMDCPFCTQQIMQRKKGYMSDEVFCKVLKEAAENNCAIRFIRWGEPFLHKNILRFIEDAKNRGILVHVTTNGLLLNKNICRRLVELELDSIIFSMQGATPEGYNKMRNTQLYGLLEKNIFMLIETRKNKDKPFVKITSTMTSETDDEIALFKEKWLAKVEYVECGKTNLSLLDYGRFKDEKNRALYFKLKKQEAIKKAYRDCNEVWHKLAVNWDGGVSACCKDYENTLLVGDIKNESLQKIWSKPPINKIRKMLLDKRHEELSPCSECFHSYERF